MRPPATAGRHQDCDRLGLLHEQALDISNAESVNYTESELLKSSSCRRPVGFVLQHRSCSMQNAIEFTIPAFSRSGLAHEPQHAQPKLQNRSQQQHRLKHRPSTAAASLRTDQEERLHGSSARSQQNEDELRQARGGLASTSGKQHVAVLRGSKMSTIALRERERPLGKQKQLLYSTRAECSGVAGRESKPAQVAQTILASLKCSTLLCSGVHDPPCQPVLCAGCKTNREDRRQHIPLLCWRPALSRLHY